MIGLDTPNPTRPNDLGYARQPLMHRSMNTTGLTEHDYHQHSDRDDRQPANDPAHFMCVVSLSDRPRNCQEGRANRISGAHSLSL